jgi:predicted ABC-type ATPase
LQTIELAKNRVATRVLEGGHNIPNNVIERRYVNGIKNLFSIYLPIIDDVMIFDNSQTKSQLIASKSDNSQLLIHDVQKYNQLKKYDEQV